MKLSYLRQAPIVLVALALLAVAGPPSASATSTPAPGYEQFTGCPHPGEKPEIVTCFRETFTGGEMQLGNIEFPIANPVKLIGGQTAAGTFHFNAFGGLLPAKQPVPGGVVGFTGFTWLEEYFGPEALLLYAQIELAGSPGDQLTEPATLPVKIRFVNAALGTKCYVGSNANPIVLNLIAGMSGEYVDSSFAVPGANGCFLTLFGFPPLAINGVIDTRMGLPSPGGSNQAVLNFNTETAAAATVYP